MFAQLHGTQSWMYLGQLITFERKMPTTKCVLIIMANLEQKNYELIHCKQRLLCILF
jgi:hypothetical protein